MLNLGSKQINSQRQHTPNPEAQDPEAVPPRFLQSLMLKQVPLFPVLEAQGLFRKVTIVNSERTAKWC